ncbi:MAG: hypothetical protein FD181_1833 [Prolixibacteraceae bacterium]|nr:MAG: hypothetical protein FD181_1833 [Prolixibacteraceae bacterium]
MLSSGHFSHAKGVLMKTFSIISVCLITVLLTVRYIWLLVKKEIKPALAMWVMFSTAVGMSLVTYLSSGNFSFFDNILNSVDLIYVVTISAAIAVFGDKTSKITRFDLGCLIVVLLIVIFWIFTQNHIVTNFLVQTILVIAYFPVVKRLFETRQNTEPFIIWIGMLIAPFLSLLSSQGILAKVYAVRAIICVGILLVIMLWIEVAGKKSKKSEITV